MPGNNVVRMTELANGASIESFVPIEIEVKHLPPIKVEDLPGYVQEKRANGDLKNQFQDLIPNNPTLSTVAASSVNIKKNRYKNIFPNDDSRVVLKSKNKADNSDYINASYINGNDGKPSYIAAQGPLLQTLDDFWQMIWQENIDKVLMLTHLTEGENRVKCEKYWPDSGTEIRYGDVTVKCTKENSFFSYILRTLEVTCASETRTILQYHFIAWPDKKIPDDSSRLLRFIQQVTPVTVEIEKPILVHCSAGIGRTGVYIAIDRQLRLLNNNKDINIFECCQDMRSNRPWMVQTVEQYLFIYDCVLEWAQCRDTFIPSIDFVKRANMSDVAERRQKELKAIETLIPSMAELRQTKGKAENNKEKNRSEEILPQDGARVILQREDTENNYINASFMDGFIKPNEFITTQIPFKSTKQDFWEMVYEYDITTIVLLDDGTESQDDIPYWPERSEDLAYGSIRIHFEVEETEEFFVKRTFTIHHEEDKDEVQCVFHYHLSQLPSMQGSLTLLDPVCEVLKEIGAGKTKALDDGLTCIQCLDGAKVTGVFVACKICIDQMELENGTDVFQAVKSLRKVQPKMVDNERQYNLIFRILERFIEKKGSEEVQYANYRKTSTCAE